MADEIFIINVGGYIGTSTRCEIDYAIAHGKTVNYLYGTGDMTESDFLLTDERI